MSDEQLASLHRKVDALAEAQRVAVEDNIKFCAVTGVRLKNVEELAERIDKVVRTGNGKSLVTRVGNHDLKIETLQAESKDLKSEAQASSKRIDGLAITAAKWGGGISALVVATGMALRWLLSL